MGHLERVVAKEWGGADDGGRGRGASETEVGHFHDLFIGSLLCVVCVLPSELAM